MERVPAGSLSRGRRFRYRHSQVEQPAEFGDTGEKRT